MHQLQGYQNKSFVSTIGTDRPEKHQAHYIEWETFNHSLKHPVEVNAPPPSFQGGGGVAFSGASFSVSGLASGLVIKHINGENRNEILPRDVGFWSSEDKQLFRESEPLYIVPKPSCQTKITLFETDTIIKKRVSHRQGSKWIGGKRGTIKMFSRSSCRNMVQTARNVAGLSHMVTLTYPAEFPCNGKITKRHLELIRKWFIYRKIGGFWFYEFQKRGAPHFHIFTTGKVDKEDLSEAWYKIVGSEDLKHLRAGTKIEAIRKPHAIAAYAAKYAAKAEQKEVPEGFEDVGRFWGCFGGVKVIPKETIIGEQTEVAHLVRVLRKLRKQDRRRLHLPAKTDRGVVGFTVYGATPPLEKYLEWYRIRRVPF